MKRGAILFIGLFSFLFLFLSLSTFVSAEVGIPQELLSFYSHDVSTLTLSNNTFVLYDNDRTVFYYLYYNGLNQTLNVTIDFTCTSKNCPAQKDLTFDYLQNDTTLPFVKKAAGIFLMTNQTPLGVYDYTLTVSDPAANYSQNASFTLTVISASLWKQFWHNLLTLIGL